jgi:hypothetical protein
LRINVSNKTAVSSEDSLDLKLVEAFARVPHHLLHLLDQILEFVVRLCIDPYFRDAPYKIVKRVADRRARGPDLLHPHLCKVLLEPVLHLLLYWAGVPSWKM